MKKNTEKILEALAEVDPDKAFKIGQKYEVVTTSLREQYGDSKNFPQFLKHFGAPEKADDALPPSKAKKGKGVKKSKEALKRKKAKELYEKDTLKKQTIAEAESRLNSLTDNLLETLSPGTELTSGEFSEQRQSLMDDFESELDSIAEFLE